MGIKLSTKMGIIVCLLGLILLIPILPSSAQQPAASPYSPQLSPTPDSPQLSPTPDSPSLSPTSDSPPLSPPPPPPPPLSPTPDGSPSMSAEPGFTNGPVADSGDESPHRSSQMAPPDGSRKKSTVVIAVVVVVVVIVVLLLGIGIFFFLRHSKKKPDVENSENGEPIIEKTVPNKPAQSPTTTESSQYDLQTLRAATNNFSDDHMIGRGGFGFVYKGNMPNGEHIAVKRLSETSGQGDKEFNSEVELLAKLRHRNLVSLLGCCLEGEEMLLVYEFVANKSLDYFIFDSLKKRQLNWSMRYNIIKGIARGMLYLHEDSPIRIIHRDLKAANILLDEDMNPKIADFGIARMTNFEQTHMSTSLAVGTYGYMAPEYFMYGKMSVKSDVYSFGVLLLEVVSGRKINPSLNKSGIGENLVLYAWRCWEEEKPLELLDPTMKDTYSEEEVMKCINIGLLSIQEDCNKRPTMAKIVHMLDTDSDTSGHPSYPQSPGFMSGAGLSDESTTTGTYSSSIQRSSQSSFK